MLTFQTILVLAIVCFVASFEDTCPKQCHCLHVSHEEAPHVDQVHEYMEKYNWVDGKMAVACFGRSRIPTDLSGDLRRDVNYILMIGSKKNRNNIQSDQPGYQSLTPVASRGIVKRPGQLKTIPIDSFQGMTNLLHLDVSENRIKRLQGDEFDDLQNVRILSLRGNRIRDLPAGVFKNLSSIQTLDLSENRLHGVKETIFYFMPNLRKLLINNNLVTALTDSIFESLPNLEVLNLAHNRIRSFSPEWLKDLRQLRELILDGNRIDLLSYEFFTGMDSLETLSLKDNRIAQMSHYVFYYLPNLRSIDLSNNQINDVDSTMLWSQENLYGIDLSYNNISKIDDLAFQHTANLVQLNLENNNIDTISSNTFSGLRNIIQLRLSSNQIAEIQSDAFADMLQLQIITLSNNRLARIEHELLSGLDMLHTLYLDNNEITDLSGEELNRSPKITWLYLRNNKLQNFGPQIFHGLHELQLVDASYNSIANIDIDTFSRQMNLKTLFLNNNQLRKIDDGVFRAANNLEIFDAGHNAIEELSRGAFTGMEKIKIVNLENNRLEEISPTVLYDIHGVEQLNLNGNNLQLLPTEMFTTMHSLKILLLANNRINTLTMPLYPQVQLVKLDLYGNELDRIRGYITVALADQASVNLAGNPWRCDCHIKNILELFKDANIEITTLDEMQCAAPEYLKGQQLEGLNADDTTCELAVHRQKSSNVFQTSSKVVTQQPKQKLPPSYDQFESSDKSQPTPPSSAQSHSSETQKEPVRVITNNRQLPANYGHEDKRIVDYPTLWPWHALVWDDASNTILCNAAIIGAKWIITTKSCFDKKFLMYDWQPIGNYGTTDLILKPQKIIVKLGKNSDLFGFERNEKNFGIRNVYAPNSAFDFETLVSGRDSPVLIELQSSAMPFTAYIQSIPLKFGGFYGSNTREKDKSRAVMSIWGSDSRDYYPKDQLRRSPMETVPCSFYSERYSLCAGNADSMDTLTPSVEQNVGAPLVNKEGNDDWQLVGLKTEKTEGDVDVFVRLREYTDWIYRRVQL